MKMFALILLSLFSCGLAQTSDLLTAINDLKSSMTSLSQEVRELKTRSVETAAALQDIKKQMDKLENSAENRHLKTSSSLQHLQITTQSLLEAQKKLSNKIDSTNSASKSCCTKMTSALSVLIPPSTTAASTPPTKPPTTTQKPHIVDCSVHERSGSVKNGIYKISAHGVTNINAWCNNGYTLIQRREFGDMAFDKTWAEYAEGFGKPEADHWMGLRHQNVLTRDRSCQLQIQLKVDAKAPRNVDECRKYGWHDCNGQIRYISGDEFRVSSSFDNFRIRIKINSTDLINPRITYGLKYFNGLAFTTKDKDLDTRPDGNCATSPPFISGGGFWYANCHPGYPNRKYPPSQCSRTNKICGDWWPYATEQILLQFRCI